MDDVNTFIELSFLLVHQLLHVRGQLGLEFNSCSKIWESPAGMSEIAIREKMNGVERDRTG
jgi:hypothetical protein